MSTICHAPQFLNNFELTGKAKQDKAITGKVDNIDGSIIYISSSYIISKRRPTMSVKTNGSQHIKVPLTFKSAMWMGISFIFIAIASAWAMYTHLDNKLETYRIGTETKIESARDAIDVKIDSFSSETRNHFEAARIEAKADNTAVNSQLQAISSSIAELNGKISKD